MSSSRSTQRCSNGVTGLTVDDFKLLSQIGLFNAQNMNSAIYQFRSFERASLLYATDDTKEQRNW